MTAILLTAFTAGLVATVNPCGFAMLPAYLGYFLGTDAGDERAVRRALPVAGTVSLGFLVVFGAAGVLITAGIRSLIDVLPWVALAVGAGLVGLGAAMVGGYHLPAPPRPGRAGAGGRRSILLFGMTYAVASLSCTLPIFLSLVAGTFTGTSFFGGVAAFLAYGLGMATLLFVVTFAVALGKDGIVRRLQRLSRHVNTVSGVILVLAGSFILWYWITVLGSGAGALASGPLRRVEEWSAAATRLIGDHAGVVAGVAAAVGAGAVAWRRMAGRAAARPEPSGAAAAPEERAA